jgi:AmiR/NasT family two-component response regulator
MLSFGPVPLRRQQGFVTLLDTKNDTSTPPRVLLADDHSIVTEGLHMFLALDPKLEVVGEAADGAEAVRLAHDLSPHVILMDLLIGHHGVQAGRR